MIPNYDTIYTNCYPGRTVAWVPGDTEDMYNYHLEHRRSELIRNGWLDYTPFTYQFNSLGFRCNEFTSDPSIMFLGCSYTIGIGLPLETIWPELISAQLKMQCVNLGIGGGSCDTAFRLCHGYIDNINPKIVVLMNPPPIRMEHILDSPRNLGINRCPDKESEIMLKLWISDENNDFFNREKNVLGIQMMCQSRGIKFIYVESATLATNCLSTSLARDLGHAGIESHRLFANEIINQF
jgi:hypothetical protein